MSAPTNGTLSKILLGLTLGIITALAAWNLKATHENASGLGILRQLVLDGKENRVAAEAQNNAAHKRIEDKLVTYDVKFSEIPELRIRLSAMESNLKALEMQITQLRLDTKNVEGRIISLEAAIKAVEVQITDLKAKLVTIEYTLKKG